MVHSRDSDSSSRYGLHQSDAPVAPVDPGDIKHEVDKLLSGSALSGALEVKTGKDGKAHFFGLSLPADIAGLLQYGLNIVKPYINKQGGEFLYDKTSRFVAQRHPGSAEAALKGHKAGLNASRIFMAAVIAADPVQQLIGVRSEHSEEREELFRAIAPVLQTIKDKSDYRSNEVIATALDRIHDNAMSGLKRLAADLPVLGLTTFFAVRDYGNLRSRKDQKFQGLQQAIRPEDQVHKEHRDLWTERHERIQRDAKEIRKANAQNPEVDKIVKKYEEHAWESYSHEDDVRRELLSHKHREDHHRESAFDGRTPSIAVTGGITQLLKSRIGRGNGQPGQPIAMDLILELKHDVENRSVADLSERIIEIFQQNERDHGRDIIGDKLLPRLRPAVDRIAEIIDNGRLDPLALIKLVGNGKIIIHENGKRSFARAAAVDALIDEQLKVLSARELRDPKEFFSNFSDPAGVQKSLKTMLNSLPEEQKPGIFSFFPPDILEQMGFKKQYITEMQEKGHDHLYHLVTAGVLELAKKDEAALEKIGLSQDDINAVIHLADQIALGDKEAVKIDVDGSKKAALAAVRMAALNEGTGFWEKLVKKAKNLPDLIAERRKQREAEKMQASDEPNDVSPDHPGVSERKKQFAEGVMAGMDSDASSRNRLAERLSERELPATSALEREEKRRRSAEPSEGVAV